MCFALNYHKTASASESNAWGGGDIDEEELLKQQQHADSSRAPSNSIFGDGTQSTSGDDHTSGLSKLKSSSMQSLTSDKNSVAGSQHSKHSSVVGAGSTKGSVAGGGGSNRNSINGSKAGSVADGGDVAGSTRRSINSLPKQGSAVSLGELSGRD